MRQAALVPLRGSTSDRMIATIPITASATGHMRNAVLLPRTVVWLLPADEPVVTVAVVHAVAEATSALSLDSSR